MTHLQFISLTQFVTIHTRLHHLFGIYSLVIGQCLAAVHVYIYIFRESTECTCFLAAIITLTPSMTTQNEYALYNAHLQHKHRNKPAQETKRKLFCVQHVAYGP